MKRYELNTVTYDTSAVSFLTNKCLSILVGETHNPKVAAALTKNFYMDDFLFQSNSVSNASELRKSIHDTLSEADFLLRKYQSNSSERLQNIDRSLMD